MTIVPLFQAQAALTDRIAAAMRAGAFRFDRQPIVDLRGASAPRFYELLARFELNMPIPEIIETLETSGLIMDLDISAARFAARMLDHDRSLDGAGLSVNVSGRSIAEPAYADALIAILANAQFARDRLVLEVTESSEITDLGAANTAIQAVRRLGCKVWLDDFGTGFASLPYLQAIEVDGVKIDGRYLPVEEGARAERMFRGIVQFCAELGVETVAEMIETPAQAELAGRIGVTYGQGWHFGRPQRFAAASLERVQR